MSTDTVADIVLKEFFLKIQETVQLKLLAYQKCLNYVVIDMKLVTVYNNLQ